MRIIGPQRWVERLFNKAGEALFWTITAEEAYEKLKNFSGKDFSMEDEVAWRQWCEDWERSVVEKRSRDDS